MHRFVWVQDLLLKKLLILFNQITLNLYQRMTGNALCRIEKFHAEKDSHRHNKVNNRPVMLKRIYRDIMNQ